MVTNLIKIFPIILWQVQFITKFMRMSLNTLSKHEYSKSKLIQFFKTHCNIIVLYSRTPSEWTLPSTFFQSIICSRLTSFPCMPNSSPILSLFFDSLLPDKQYKLLNSTICTLLLPVPLSSVQTLFPSFCSQPSSLYMAKSTPQSYKPFFMLFIPCIFLQSIF